MVLQKMWVTMSSLPPPNRSFLAGGGILLLILADTACVRFSKRLLLLGGRGAHFLCDFWVIKISQNSHTNLRGFQKNKSSICAGIRCSFKARKQEHGQNTGVM